MALALWGGAGCIAEPGDELADTSSALTNDEVYRDLAMHWAPQIYQDTDSTDYKSDYITNFNFDGDYNGKNNWESLDSFTTVPAHVYYSVSETLTHYFIGYYIFHPRDWHEFLDADRHENDMEGVVLAVQKGTGYGTLIAMETKAHKDQYQYAAASGITGDTDDVDGTVELASTSHPKIFVEAKGHGIYGCDSRCSSAPGGDGIVYVVGDTAESPSSGSGNWSGTYGYRLIAMDSDGTLDGNEGLWHRRYSICDTCTFGTWGKFRGDTYGTNSADAPWRWDDSDDGQSYGGDTICNPAIQFDIHFNGTPFDSNFSQDYVNHVYRTHSLEIIAVRSDANRDSLGGASDIYAKVIATGSITGTTDVVSASAWKKANAALGTYYPFEYGLNNAEGVKRFGDSFQTHSFCRPRSSQVTFSVYDSDGTNADDHMGTSAAFNASTDHSAGLDLGDSRIKFRLTVY
jgi:hypothetical protein